VKTAPKKVAKKPAKPAAKKPAKKAPAKVAKKPPVKAAAKIAKKAAVKPVKNTPTKAAAAVKPITPPAAKPAAPAPKADKPTAKTTKPAAKSKSSLTDFPVPPPPAKTAPFVPEAPPAKTKTNGSHSPVFILKQRQRLLDLRDSLVDSMSGMTRDTIRNAPEGSEASGSGQHQGDAGSDAYDRDFALSVLAKEQDALYEIEQALRRIQTGTYGVCEISSHKIPTARLEAIPFARLTVECQAQWEKEYGKRRFRPSDEVGFSGGNHFDDEDSDTVSLDEDED
jgi:RNA polymerase-binding transcription factor DksA